MAETLAAKALFSLALGFMVGLQREMHNIYKQRTDFGGARTFAIIGLLGFASAWGGAAVVGLPVVALGIVGALILMAYRLDAKHSGQMGLTTEIAALLTFVVGLLLYHYEATFPVILAVTLIFILNIKERIERFERFIEPRELNAAVMFLMMTFVILPVVPDRAVDPWGLFNPYVIWLMVVLVAGISFSGYLAIRLFGSGHGSLLTGLLGGLTSSTAVAISFARHARNSEGLHRQLAAGIAVACSVMFGRTLMEVYIVNAPLVKALLAPSLAALLAGYLFVLYLWHSAREDVTGEALELKNPFELKEALLFGLIFGVVVALVALAERYAGASGVYAVSFVSSITDVDAIALSLSNLAKSSLDAQMAANGIALAMVTNSWAKALMVWLLGGRAIGGYVALYTLIVVVVFGAVWAL